MTPQRRASLLTKLRRHLASGPLRELLDAELQAARDAYELQPASDVNRGAVEALKALSFKLFTEELK